MGAWLRFGVFLLGAVVPGGLPVLALMYAARARRLGAPLSRAPRLRPPADAALDGPRQR
jgi:hypothetical protein